MRKILAVVVLGLLLIPLLYTKIRLNPALDVEVEHSTIKGLFLALMGYFDTSSALLLGGFLLGGMLLSCPLQHLLPALLTLFKTSPLDTKEAGLASALFRRLAGLTVGAALMGCVTTLMVMLFNLDDPTAIGPATAGALFPLLYSGLLGSVFFYSLASDVDARAWPPDLRPLPIRRQP